MKEKVTIRKFTLGQKWDEVVYDVIAALRKNPYSSGFNGDFVRGILNNEPREYRPDDILAVYRLHNMLKLVNMKGVNIRRISIQTLCALHSALAIGEPHAGILRVSELLDDTWVKGTTTVANRDVIAERLELISSELEDVWYKAARLAICISEYKPFYSGNLEVLYAAVAMLLLQTGNGIFVLPNTLSVVQFILLLESYNKANPEDLGDIENSIVEFIKRYTMEVEG